MFTIEHRPGRLHKNADGLSRVACKQCKINHTMNTCQTVNKLEGEDGLTLERSLKCLQHEDKMSRKSKTGYNKRDSQTRIELHPNLSLLSPFVLSGTDWSLKMACCIGNGLTMLQAGTLYKQSPHIVSVEKY